MPIWKRSFTLEDITSLSADTAVSHLGIEFTEIGDDFLRGRVHVDQRTCQPYGILHGGVNVVLAETLGSVAAACSIPEGWRSVGLNVSANHVRAARRAGSRARPAPCTWARPPMSGPSNCTTKPAA